MTLNTDKEKLVKRSALISLLIGIPIGLFTTAIAIFGSVVFTGIATISLFMYPIIGLIISFFIILWFAGKNATKDLIKGKKLLSVSLKYSLTINSVIWLTFILLSIITPPKGFDLTVDIFIPVILHIVFTILTTFTIGLFICFLIKKTVTANTQPLTR